MGELDPTWYIAHSKYILKITLLITIIIIQIHLWTVWYMLKANATSKTFTRYTSDEHLWAVVFKSSKGHWKSSYAVLSRGTLVSEHLLLIIDWDFSMALFQVFQVAYVIIKAANAPRPGNWILERSVDGVEFSPWQYYAVSDTECLTHYNITPRRGPPTYRADDEVICTSYYSRLVPLEHGEVRRPLPAGRSVFPHLPMTAQLSQEPKWRIQNRSLLVQITEIFNCWDAGAEVSLPAVLMLHVAPDTCYFIDFFRSRRSLNFTLLWFNNSLDPPWRILPMTPGQQHLLIELPVFSRKFSLSLGVLWVGYGWWSVPVPCSTCPDCTHIIKSECDQKLAVPW